MHHKIQVGLRAVAVALTVGLAACGSDSNEPAVPTTGTLIFAVDPVTCLGSGTVELFIDATSQGSYVMSGGSQRSYTVSAGTHTAGAREIGGSAYVWPTQNVTVPAAGSYTATLVCQ